MHITPEDVYQVDEAGEKLPVTLMPNQFVILKADQSARKTQLGRFDGKKSFRSLFIRKSPTVFPQEMSAKNSYRRPSMADAEGAPLVIVKGMAGTAKTFYTLAVGLHAMLEQEEPAYRRILISRPNAQFDDDIGFLPGDESEKIAPVAPTGRRQSGAPGGSK